VIVVATSMPSSMVPRQLGPLDKVAHFSMYAVLAALATAAVRKHRSATGALILTVLAIAAFGAIDEWHQRFIPGRSTEFADWVADTVGGFVGVTVASLFIPWWSKRQHV
jgi:VanZ family protein